ncbi:hypothetical protein LZZ90_08830 [Flavobacterium sp. SM15]|uniref:hypothetical protein n=1 Tax=Flavobacterium sp. SM15 TaxID=2908005 RepID=UPI001EDA3DA3|nr:hypothetical protein [Flavobacterium sp. SM15]MCG2611609.1 hypothetical protein [Flavobacterium sp. SM15]
MAKQNGFLKIEGTLDNLIFYKRDGTYYVRKKGGISKERIHHEPNFIRTRENNSEFGSCGSSGKMLRQALGTLIIRAKDSQLHSRLLSVLLQIKNCDTLSVRGKRNVATGIATTEGKQLLMGFNFNANALLNTVLHAAYDLNTSTGAITITALRPAKQISYPNGATHVSFQSAVCVVDFETQAHEVAYSAVVNFTLNLTPTSFSLLPTHIPNITGTQLFLLSLTFYQEINGVQYALKEDGFNVLGVVGVV